MTSHLKIYKSIKLPIFNVHAIFDISDPKSLGIDIHKAINLCFNFGLLFEAKEAVTEPHESQRSIHICRFWYLLPKTIGINIHQGKSNYIFIYRSSYKLMFQLWPLFQGHRGRYIASQRSRISLKDIFDICDLKNLKIDIHKPIYWCFDFGLNFKAKEALIRPHWGQG